MNNAADNSIVKPQWFACWLILVLVLPAAALFYQNISADPFQLVFKDDPTELAFMGRSGQDRYQNPGVVLHYQPRSVIIGHSLAANFQPTRMEQALGWEDVYNLSMNGSTIYEQRRVLSYALDNADPSRVFWLFFPPNLGLPARVKSSSMVFPGYLYDHSRMNDLRFFATLPSNFAPYVEQKNAAREMLLEFSRQQGAPVDARDYATNWQLTRKNLFNAVDEVAEGIMGDLSRRPAKFIRNLQQGRDHLSPADIAALPVVASSNFHQNVALNIESMVSAYPDVEFVIVPMPPLSLMHWQNMRATDEKTYLEQLGYVRRFVELMSDHDNVRVYGFGLSPLAEDLRLYRDYGHYHMAVNEAMLEEIARGGPRLTRDNINRHLSDFDRKVLDYRLRQYEAVSIPAEQSLKVGQLGLVEGRQIVEAILARGN